jgi:proteic killer suppression protein
VIRSFRHKGLKQLYDRGDRRRVLPAYADKIERVLARLDEATSPASLDLPGYRLHPLKGDLAQALKRADDIKVKRVAA